VRYGVRVAVVVKRDSSQVFRFVMDVDYLVCLYVCHVINITTLETGVSQPVWPAG
jgi:hypothetical protein